MTKIVQGTISPITVDKLNLKAFENLTVEVLVKDPSIFIPTFESLDPVVVTEETLQHAAEVAAQILNMIDSLPATSLSGDLITLAMAVMHYQACK